MIHIKVISEQITIYTQFQTLDTGLHFKLLYKTQCKAHKLNVCASVMVEEARGCVSRPYNLVTPPQPPAQFSQRLGFIRFCVQCY